MKTGAPSQRKVQRFAAVFSETAPRRQPERGGKDASRFLTGPDNAVHSVKLATVVEPSGLARKYVAGPRSVKNTPRIQRIIQRPPPAPGRGGGA